MTFEITACSPLGLYLDLETEHLLGSLPVFSGSFSVSFEGFSFIPLISKHWNTSKNLLLELFTFLPTIYFQLIISSLLALNYLNISIYTWNAPGSSDFWTCILNDPSDIPIGASSWYISGDLPDFLLTTSPSTPPSWFVNSSSFRKRQLCLWNSLITLVGNLDCPYLLKIFSHIAIWSVRKVN